MHTSAYSELKAGQTAMWLIRKYAAEQVAGEDISERIKFFGEVDAELISTPDTDFKFHSGVSTSS